MTRDELIAKGTKLYGRKKWMTRIAKDLNKSISSLWRMQAGQVKVPGYMDIYFENKEREKRMNSLIRKLKV